MDSPLILEPSEPARYSMIWFHGLGAYATDMASLAELLALPADCPIRHVCAQAALRPVTVNQGMVMPAWYDLHGLTVDSHEDRPGIQAAFRNVKTLIQTENKRGIPTENIIFAGFSMGGGLALYSALSLQQPIAGIVALSGYLPLAQEFATLQAIQPELPIFLASGSEDDIVLPQWSLAIRDALTHINFTNITCNTYPMGHMVCAEEINDLRQWLVSNFAL